MRACLLSFYGSVCDCARVFVSQPMEDDDDEEIVQARVQHCCICRTGIRKTSMLASGRTPLFGYQLLSVVNVHLSVEVLD